MSPLFFPHLRPSGYGGQARLRSLDSDGHARLRPSKPTASVQTRSKPWAAFLPESHRVGKDGEDTAIRYLRGLGYAILGRDVSMGKEEIDIIAFDPRDGVIVFVEVKARSKHYDDFSPLLAATFRKRANVMRAAKRWIGWRKEERGFRLDLISVEEGEVTEHLEEVPWRREKGYGY